MSLPKELKPCRTYWFSICWGHCGVQMEFSGQSVWWCECKGGWEWETILIICAYYQQELWYTWSNHRLYCSSAWSAIPYTCLFCTHSQRWSLNSSLGLIGDDRNRANFIWQESLPRWFLLLLRSGTTPTVQDRYYSISSKATHCFSSIGCPWAQSHCFASLCSHLQWNFCCWIPCCHPVHTTRMCYPRLQSLGCQNEEVGIPEGYVEGEFGRVWARG